jgi:hypothetical protein
LFARVEEANVNRNFLFDLDQQYSVWRLSMLGVRATET